MAPKTLRERNRSAAMADIRRVAIREMTRAGFDGVTVAGIAGVAGVSPSTVYRYFGTKEALVIAPRLGHHLVTSFAAWSRSRPDDSIVGVFRRSATEVFDHDEDRGEVRAALTLAFADPALADALLVELAGSAEPLADAIAVHRGRDAPSTRDTALAGALLGVLLAVLRAWTESAKPLKKLLDKQLGLLNPPV